jgi:hypothetical protein
MVHGSVRMAVAGLLVLVAYLPALAQQGTAGGTIVIVDALASIEVRPAGTHTLAAGDRIRFEAVIGRLDGSIGSGMVRWRTSDSTVVSIDANSGVAVARRPGAARVWAELSTAPRRGAAPVLRSEPGGQPGPRPSDAGLVLQPATVPDGDLVRYPMAEIGFLLGPQLRSGSRITAWPWFDRNAEQRGLEFVAEAAVDSYYDHALVQYINHYRTGDPRFLEAARRAADRLLREHEGQSPAPRNVSLGGLLVRAVELHAAGDPRGRSIFEWSTEYLRLHDLYWLNRHYQRPRLWYGVREGGFVLLYMAQIARVHPDRVVRAEMLERARKASVLYFARLQREDGGWYWTDEIVEGGQREFSQPFQVGFLLEGLIATHQQLPDTTIARAIVRGTDWLWNEAYIKPGQGGVCDWRAMRYFVWRDGERSVSQACSETHSVHEARQLNAPTVHAFGYAWRLTGDERFRHWGDEVFASTFGHRSGVGGDGRTGLAFYRGKEYNQSYRSAGRYLVWRTAPP